MTVLPLNERRLVMRWKYQIAKWVVVEVENDDQMIRALEIVASIYGRQLKSPSQEDQPKPKKHLQVIKSSA
jgi:hypothetical protein